jgi:hypothetical protein
VQARGKPAPTCPRGLLWRAAVTRPPWSGDPCRGRLRLRLVSRLVGAAILGADLCCPVGKRDASSHTYEPDGRTVWFLKNGSS